MSSPVQCASDIFRLPPGQFKKELGIGSPGSQQKMLDFLERVRAESPTFAQNEKPRPVERKVKKVIEAEKTTYHNPFAEYAALNPREDVDPEIKEPKIPGLEFYHY